MIIQFTVQRHLTWYSDFFFFLEEEESNKLEYISKYLRFWERLIVHYLNPISIVLSNCVLFLTLKYSCKSVSMKSKMSFILCCLKREVLGTSFSAFLSTPTLWNLMLCKPLQYVDWPSVTQSSWLPHCTLQWFSCKYITSFCFCFF